MMLLRMALALLYHLAASSQAINCHSPNNAEQIYYALFRQNSYHPKIPPFNFTIRHIVAPLAVESVREENGIATLLFASLLVWTDHRYPHLYTVAPDTQRRDLEGWSGKRNSKTTSPMTEERENVLCSHREISGRRRLWSQIHICM